jgi:hypothetical protein
MPTTLEGSPAPINRIEILTGRDQTGTTQRINFCQSYRFHFMFGHNMHSCQRQLPIGATHGIELGVRITRLSVSGIFTAATAQQ